MTKLEKQRKFVVEEFKKSLTMDRWGNFKIGSYRVKLQKNNFRLEKKFDKSWVRFKSILFKDVTAEEIAKIVKLYKSVEKK